MVLAFGVLFGVALASLLDDGRGRVQAIWIGSSDQASRRGRWWNEPGSAAPSVDLRCP